MKQLFRKKEGTQYGALIEVGSASVSVGIVESNPKLTHPNIIWSKREFAYINKDYDMEQSQKSLLTTLMNSFMTLDSAGRSALLEHNSSARLSKLQVSISAPWAHTISKVVEYEKEKEFEITADMINSLALNASERTLASLQDSINNSNNKLSIITKAITDVSGNGYQTTNPVGQIVNSLSITQVSALAETSITAGLKDLSTKLFPDISCEMFSTMIIFHTITKDLYPTMSEYCLVNLTYEATEIAIVRADVLQYTTHCGIGVNTLIRNLSIRLKTTEADAATIINNTNYESTTKTEREAVSRLLSEYQTALEDLFLETGDSLVIPKVVFLHAAYQQEQFFYNTIITAARKATNSSHTIHTISSDLLSTFYKADEKQSILTQGSDTAILLAAQFFHKQALLNDQD